MLLSKLNQNCEGSTTSEADFRLRDLNWGLIFLLYTVLGVLSAGAVYTSTLASRGSVPYYLPLLIELTGFYTALALLPLILIGFKWLPINRRNWYWSVPVHLLLSVLFGAVHTLMMFLSRRAAFALFGLGTFDYGDMTYRFLMEYHKKFLAYWIIFAVLRSLLYYRNNRQRERQRAALELRSSELQRQLANVQMQALRSQLNPHFLFNTLNMISSVMYEDVKRADHMISALSRMLRYSLEQHVEARVPLRKELDFVNAALELMHARFPDTLKVEIRCDPDTLDLLVPTMLLHTFIENAVKHHSQDSSTQITIDAHILRKGNRLEIKILDNGPGIIDRSKIFQNGVGLSNARDRLRGLYGDEHRFELENRPEGGLKVEISLPAQERDALVSP